MFVRLIFITCLLQCASAVTTSSGEYQTRANRLLTFDTEDDGSISVELAFNVPFLRIPVKRTMDMTKGAVANLNLGAVALAAMMIFSASIFIPAVLHLLNKKNAAPTDGSARQRSEDGEAPEWLRLLDESLQTSNVNATSCVQRFTCWLVKNSAGRVAAGTASSGDKLIDGLASNDWLRRSFVEGSILDEAVQKGLDGTNCSKLYSTCKVTQRAVHNFLKQFATNINQ